MKVEGRKHNVIKIIAAVTFILIAVFSAIFKADILNVLPLFISIFIMFLQSKVNRYAFLLGGLNSILYAVAYFYMTLYSTALYALLVSFPIQIFTFFNWKKNTQNGQTQTKSLTVRGRIIMFASMALIWLVFFLIFSAFDSAYLIFDNTLSVFGIVTSVLCALRFSEYALLQSVSTCANIVLYGFMITDDLSKIVWLIFSLYSATCSVVAFINISRQSKKGE